MPAAQSPGFTRVTLSPTATTFPTPSDTGMSGKRISAA